MNTSRLARLAALSLAAATSLGAVCLLVTALGLTPKARAAGEAVQFSAASYSAVENGGGVQVVVNLTSTVTGGPITFTVTSADNTAQSASDYAPVNATISLDVGAAGFTFTVPITDDAVFEGNEAFTLTLGNFDNAIPGSITTAVVTITENESQPTVQLSSSNFGVAEGTANATINATLSGQSALPVSVNATTTDGSAGAGDYTGGTYALSFAPLATAASASIPITDDLLDENDETFTVTLGSPTNTTISGTSSATVTISDNDAPPTISLTAATQTVAEGVGTVTVGVSLNAASGLNVSVPFSVGGTAGGADHSLAAGAFTVNAGALTGDTSFNVVSDSVDEENETIIVTLGTPSNAGLGAITAQTITLNDDDDPPTLAVADIGVLEGDAGPTAATFTLNLSAASERIVTVNAATADGTALAGADYTGNSGTVTFNPGQTSRPFNVNVLGDVVDEANETFVINLSGATNVNAPDLQATAVITDDEAAPSVTINDVAVTEGDGSPTTATFTVSLSNPSQSTVTVQYETANGTATSPADFAGTSGSLTFNPGTLTQPISVTVQGDTLDEDNETFAVNLTAATNATITDPGGAGTITDNDPLPGLNVNDVTVTEGTGTVNNATFTITLAPTSGRTVTVNYSTANGTATAGNDFTATSGVLTFNAGVTTQTVSVPITTDAADEADSETFTLELSSPGNATLGDASGLGTINDDDPPPTLTLGNGTVVEGDSGSVNMAFTAQLNAASGRAVTVNYAAVGDTATADSDFTAVTGTLNFAAGVTQVTLNVPVLGDLLDEANETLFVNLSSPTNAVLGTTQATGSIQDNDPTPAVGFGAAGVAVDEGAGTAAVTVNLTGSTSSFTVTVPYTVSGTASPGGVDHNLANGAFSIAPGATSGSVSFTINNDTLDEANETVIVTLGTPVNATPGAITVQTITLNDNDAPPTVQLFSGAYSVGENAGPATLTVTLSAQSGLPVSVNFATSNGTATAGNDYAAASGTLTVTAGLTQTALTVPIINDTTFEAAETFSVALTAPNNATLGAPNTATVTINSEDGQPTISFTPASFNVVEDTGGVGALPNIAPITVTLSNASVNTITVNYATSNGTATAGSDYTAASGTLTFNPGVTTQAFSVTTMVDDTDEGSIDETVNLALSVATGGATIAGGAGVLNISDNEGRPTVRFGTGPQSVAENAGPLTVLVTLSNPSDSTITVTVTSSNNTAIAGQDYTAVNGVVVFTPGDTVEQFNVALNNEAIFEANETFTLTLSNAINADLGSSNIVKTVTIINDDPVPTVQFNPAAYAIGEAAGSVTLTASLSNLSAFTGTVNYATGNGAALAGSDYATRTGTLNFPALTSALTFTVPITNDTVYEGNETFNATLSGVTGFTLGASVATVTIVENDNPPVVQFSAAGYSRAEDNGPATITVTLAGSSAVTSTINYATSNGTATAPSDYLANSGTLTFPAGTTARTFDVALVNNATFEGDETVLLTLSAPVSATLGANNPATLTIVENDPAPTINLASGPSVNEETATVTVNATLSAASAVTTTVNYATSSGTATSGADFAAASGTLTFTPGDTSESIVVTINNDPTYELNETFNLSLSAPVSGTLGASAATVTLLNTDAAPVVQLSPTDLTLGEDRGPATITVTLSAVSAVTATVNYATNNGSAIAGSDFAAISGTLSFAPGVTIQTLTVPLINDANNELNETFTLALGATTHSNVGGAASAIVTIANEDARPGCFIHKSSDTPKLIPDANATGVQSVLNVAGPGVVISDFSLRLDSISHTYVEDLRLTLISPAGQTMVVIGPNGIGGSGDDFVYTVFNDSGPYHEGALPPYTGTYRPQPAPTTVFTPLLGQASGGTWTLKIVDVVSGDIGTLNAWGVEVCGTVIPPTGNTRIFLPLIRK